MDSMVAFEPDNGSSRRRCRCTHLTRRIGSGNSVCACRNLGTKPLWNSLRQPRATHLGFDHLHRLIYRAAESGSCAKHAAAGSYKLAWLGGTALTGIDTLDSIGAEATSRKVGAGLVTGRRLSRAEERKAL